MYLEFRHLRTIRAIYQSGSLARAADVLHITQSALSHQIKALEDQVGMELFYRRTKPMRLSPAGVKLLRLAEHILPEVTHLEEDLRALKSGRSGRLHLALECHACFDWIFPVFDKLRHAWPEVDLDIRQSIATDAFDALRREEVDFVISSDPQELAGVNFSPLFDYEPRMVAHAGHPMAQQKFAQAETFEDDLLLTYPVERTKTDAFTTFFMPARIEPRAIRQVELTQMILMLVAAARGVAVLPDWVLRPLQDNPDFVTRPLGPQGVTKRMYGATRQEDTMVPYIAHMIRLCRSEPVKQQRL